MVRRDRGQGRLTSLLYADRKGRSTVLTELTKVAQGLHLDNLAQPDNCHRDSATCFWKYCIVRFNPSLRLTFGSQPSNCRARVISGFRTFGSSCGNGLKTGALLLPDR